MTDAKDPVCDMTVKVKDCLNEWEVKMKKLLTLCIAVSFIVTVPLTLLAEETKGTFLIHLKTSLKKDDAQICVAYNVMWAAIEEGFNVKVLVDADAVNTYKVGWRGRDDIEGYKIPENLRQALVEQFSAPLETVPKTYGEYLLMLRDKGVEFYINTGFLIVSKIGTPDNLLDKISAKFFQPVTLKEMVGMRKDADYYMAY